MFWHPRQRFLRGDERVGRWWWVTVRVPRSPNNLDKPTGLAVNARGREGVRVLGWFGFSLSPVISLFIPPLSGKHWNTIVLSPTNRLDMTEILLKGYRWNRLSSVHSFPRNMFCNVGEIRLIQRWVQRACLEFDEPVLTALKQAIHVQRNITVCLDILGYGVVSWDLKSD